MSQEMIKIYLDNCCFNRHFDDQGQMKIKLQSDAKLFIQEAITQKKLEVVWSYVLDYENYVNPFDERKEVIQLWKKRSIDDINEDEHIIALAQRITKFGIKGKDALHVACAIQSGCKYFITTDESIIKKSLKISEIVILDPIDFIRRNEI